ncbi:MAG: YraN family protein, partial [Prevotella sp.]|nr:YraN family protein [Prevotella sp.]
MINCQSLIEKGDSREESLDDSPEHIQMGIWGEELATVYLREKGYIILERDWHSKHRDIDIVAWHDGYIVFVEVKTRRNRDFADPVKSVNIEKQKNLCRAINHYIHYRKPDYPWRFDVITIVGELGTTKPEITHIEDFRLQCR